MIASTILWNLCDEVHWSLARIVGEGDCDVLVGAMVLCKAAEFVTNGASNYDPCKHNSSYERSVSMLQVACEGELKQSVHTIAAIKQPDELDVMLANPCRNVLLELDLRQIASEEL